MRSNNEWPKYHNEDGQEGGDSATTKPNIRRRSSRASKKTPTTLLNANANNFRSLVQQFTGCPSSDPNLLYLSNRKGPLNLNFCLNNATPIVESPPILPPVYPLISHPQQQQPLSTDNNHNIIGQDQQRYSPMFSSSSSSLDGICMTNYTTQNHAFNNNNNGTMEMISDSFVMDDNYALSILDYAPSTEY